MKESKIETTLRDTLQSWGFKCLKLETPGTAGTKDRLILEPTWAPAPPSFVELKRPGKDERALQAAVRDDWRARGCIVHDCCDTLEDVQALCDHLLTRAVIRYCAGGHFGDLPDHIRAHYVNSAHRITQKLRTGR